MTPRTGRWTTALVTLAVGGVYFATACRYALGGDSAEFAAMVARGGVPHPSGYPLYVLCLRAFAWLPTSPAHAASLSTALIGLAGVWAVMWSARRWGATAISAALAGLCFALAPITWKMATSPEAFALNATLCALIVGVAAPGAGPRGASRVALLALLAGLGLSNHLTSVLLAPVGLWAVGRAFVVERAGWKAGAFGVIGLALGLCPYLTLLATRGDSIDVWAWGDTSTWAGLWRHAIRSDFGSLQHGVSGVRDVGGQLGLLGASLLAGNGLVWLVGLAGLPLAWKRHPELRVGHVMLLAALLLCGPGFVSYSNISMSELTALVMGRFHELPIVLLAVLAARGIDAWVDRLREKAPALQLSIAASAVVSAVVGWPGVREHHRPTVELWARSVLAHVPPKAVVMGTGDARVFPIAYAQVGLSLREDVVYVDPWLMLHAWYRVRLARKLGFEIDTPVGKSVDTIAFARKVLASGRPLFVTNHFTTSFPQKLTLYPSGPIFRAVPRDEKVPALPEVERSMVDSERDLETEPVAFDSWGGDLVEWRARGWLWLADAYERDGDVEGAVRARDRTKALAPWLFR